MRSSPVPPLITTIIILSTLITRTFSLPLLQQPPPISRRDQDTTSCEYYVRTESNDSFNEYVVEIANWDDSSTELFSSSSSSSSLSSRDSGGGCAADIANSIKTQCTSDIDAFACEKVPGSSHDTTRMTFHVDKHGTAAAQPACVTRALSLSLAGGSASKDRAIECFCIAGCQPSDLKKGQVGV